MKYSTRHKLVSRLLLRLIYLPTALLMIVAALIYNFQDAITPIVSSYDFCNNDSVLKVSGWIFPKLISHCKAIYFTHLKDHPSADIAIIIDVYVMLSFFVLLALWVSLIRKLPMDLSSPRAKKFMGNLLVFWGYFAVPILFSCAVIYFVFVDYHLLNLKSVRYNKWFATFSTIWGLGSLLQVILIMVGSFSVVVAIGLVRLRFLLKGDSYTTEDPPSEDEKSSN